MNIFKKILKAGKSVLGVAGPTLGMALGGPFGAMAVSKLTKILGVKEGDLPNILANPTLDQHDKLVIAEAQFKKEIEEKKIDLEMYRIDAADRDSARDREIKTGDVTNKILAGLVTVGFFAVLGVSTFVDLSPAALRTFDNMVGILGTVWIQIITYYFGSSKGSKDKTTLINGQANG